MHLFAVAGASSVDASSGRADELFPQHKALTWNANVGPRDGLQHGRRVETYSTLALGLMVVDWPTDRVLVEILARLIELATVTQFQS